MIQQIIDQSGIIHIFKGKQTEPIKLVIGEILTAEIMDIFPTGTIQVKINDRIINAQPQRELPLNKGDTVMVKVEKPLEDGSIPLRVLSTSETLETQKSIAKTDNEISEKIVKLIESFFLQASNQAKQSQQTQIEILKSLLTFPIEKLSQPQKASLLQKIMEQVFPKLTTAESLQELIQFLENNNFSKEQVSQLKNLLITNHEELTTEKLKQTLFNTGVSFEAKLKQILSDSIKGEQIKEDLKFILNSIAKEAKSHGMEEITSKTEQILRQIEGYQVLSKTYQSFFTFLPLLWKEIEGGNIAYKSLKRHGKEYHTVFVSLNFKEEHLSFVVTMINKSFFISFSGGSEIINSIRQYEAQLRKRFLERGMKLGGINYISKIEELLRQWNINEGSVSLTV